jgi:hypothetical protein
VLAAPALVSISFLCIRTLRRGSIEAVCSILSFPLTNPFVRGHITLDDETTVRSSLQLTWDCRLGRPITAVDPRPEFKGAIR